MTKSVFFYPVLYIAIFLVLSNTALASSLMINAPRRASQGNAIIVKATMLKPTKNAVFTWRGKSVSVPFVSSRKQWIASVVLPIPIDEKNNIILKVTAGPYQAQKVVHVDKVNWETQNITLSKDKQDYVKPPKELIARIAKEKELTTKTLSKISNKQYWNKQFIRPVPGIITSQFGGKRIFNGTPISYHRGVDLQGAEGTPIKALTKGRVVLAQNLYCGGNAVIIDHGQGFYSGYYHMSKIKVKIGDIVQPGHTIGLVGSTGRVTGPHLHLEVCLLGSPVNPMSLF